MLMQKEDHHNTVSAQLDTLIHQGKKRITLSQSPSLLKLMRSQTTPPKEVQKMEIVPPTDDGRAPAHVLGNARGRKGEKGDKGDKATKVTRGRTNRRRSTR